MWGGREGGNLGGAAQGTGERGQPGAGAKLQHAAGAEQGGVLLEVSGQHDGRVPQMVAPQRVVADQAQRQRLVRRGGQRVGGGGGGRRRRAEIGRLVG